MGSQDARAEEHVGYWDKSYGFLPLNAMPRTAEDQRRFLDRARPLFAISLNAAAAPAVPSTPRPKPSAEQMDRLTELTQVYRAEGCMIWLLSPHPLLGDESAAALWLRGEYDRVLQVVDQLVSGAFT